MRAKLACGKVVLVDLHPAMTLIDYGVSSETKDIEFFLSNTSIAYHQGDFSKRTPDHTNDSSNVLEKVENISTGSSGEKSKEVSKSKCGSGLFSGMKKGFLSCASKSPKSNKKNTARLSPSSTTGENRSACKDMSEDVSKQLPNK